LLQFTDLRESTAIVRYAETLFAIGIAPIERQKVQMDSTEPILELVLLLHTLIDHQHSVIVVFQEILDLSLQLHLSCFQIENFIILFRNNQVFFGHRFIKLFDL
jgi:hypothetical protein